MLLLVIFQYSSPQSVSKGNDIIQFFDIFLGILVFAIKHADTPLLAVEIETAYGFQPVIIQENGSVVYGIAHGDPTRVNGTNHKRLDKIVGFFFLFSRYDA